MATPNPQTPEWRAHLARVPWHGHLARDVFPSRFSRNAAIALALLLLSLLTVFIQEKRLGMGWHETKYREQLEQIVTGQAPGPQQYRLLSPHVTVALIHWTEWLGLPRAAGVTLIGIRVAQNFAILLAALCWFRRLGIGLYPAVLGICALTWSMTQCHDGTGLAIDLYTELLFMILTAIALHARRQMLVVILVGLAALNRETGFVLPFLVMAGLPGAPESRAGRPCHDRRRVTVACAVASWLTYGAVRAAIVSVLGPRDAGTLSEHWFAVSSVLSSSDTWSMLAGALSITPIVALYTWRSWPSLLSRFFWFLGPLYLTGCLAFDPQGLGHAWLAPQALVLLPGMLYTIDAERRSATAQVSSRRPAFLCAVLLTVFTVYYQIQFQGGLAWYEQVQWERTVQVMHNQQGTPWQYRLFTDSIVYSAVRTCEALGVTRPIGVAFVLIRLGQNLLLFLLVIAFLRRLGLGSVAGLFGAMLLAGGMCHGLYDTDMTFNTYTDISIFLIAALLILNNKHAWLVPLIMAAAFNRETSGCIPFMLLFSQWRRDLRWGAPSGAWIVFGLCLGLWIAIVGGMRLPFVFGIKPYIVPTAGVKPVLPLLLFNLTWPRTWIFLLATLGLLPLLALLHWRTWPPVLRRFFWAIVPVWFALHFSLAHAPETRLFLVPQALVFLPGALAALRAQQEVTPQRDFGIPSAAPL